MLINQLTVTGHLGRDPEMNYTTAGKAVCKMNVAVDQGKDQKPIWVRVTCWEKVAERISEQAHKGDEVYIQGRFQVRTYQDKTGVERQSIEVTASTVQLTQRTTRTETTDDGLGDLDDHPF